MKFRHNKKRNTAFLYESLVRELTKTIINEDLGRKAEVMSLIREFFKKGTLLAKELELYKTLCEAKQLKTRIAEKLIKEAKSQYSQLDKKEIFEQQSSLIKKVNKSLITTYLSILVWRLSISYSTKTCLLRRKCY